MVSSFLQIKLVKVGLHGDHFPDNNAIIVIMKVWVCLVDVDEHVGSW